MWVSFKNTASKNNLGSVICKLRLFLAITQNPVTSVASSGNKSIQKDLS